MFLRKDLPGQSKPNEANAASAMGFSQWNFNERTRRWGRVKMRTAMNVDEEANSIIPVKPMVLLTVPVKMQHDKFVLLG